MFNTCYLHIGFEKTGTTSIQRFLHRNRAALAGRGFYHPQSLDAPNNTFLYVYAAEEERINDAHRVARRGLSTEEFRSKIRSDLKSELTDRKGNLVVSNEHLHSELRSIEAISRVRELLSPYCEKIFIVAYLRRQDRTAVSQYSTAIKSGLSYLPEVFVNVEKGIDYYFDYDAVLKNYSSVFGRENLIVRVFEKENLVGQDVVLDFADAIGLKDFSWLEKQRPTNESLRPIALRFLAEANKHLPLIVGNGPNPVRERLVAAMELHHAGSGPVVARAKAKAFYDAFAESNERVRREYFPDRPALFSDDFSMYPETPTTERELTFEDAARVASILWASVT
jgi:hypothetical protein